MFQNLLQWILDSCLLSFKYGDYLYRVGDNRWDNYIVLLVNFIFWVILAFFFSFFIKFFKWCVRKCLRK